MTLITEPFHAHPKLMSKLGAN